MQRQCSALHAVRLLPPHLRQRSSSPTQDAYGELKIVDSAGAEVNVAVADPVGTRPEPCPGGAYYVAEVPTDSSKLVLTDCATGTEQHTVELQGQ